MIKSQEKIFKNPRIAAFLACFCCFLWGSSYPIIKIGYSLLNIGASDTGAQMLFAGVRFFLAGVLTVAFLCVKNKKIVLPQKQNLGKIFNLSLFQTFLQYLFFYIGLANSTSVKASLMEGTSVFFALLIASIIYKQEKLTNRKIISCIVGFSGVFIVNMNGLQFNMNFLGEGFVLISAIAYGASSVLAKRYSKYEDPVLMSGYQFVFGGAALIIVGLLFGANFKTVSPGAIGVVVFLACSSMASYALWGLLLKHNPVSKITVFSFTIQIFAFLLTKLLTGENSGLAPLNAILATALICGGIYIANSGNPELKNKVKK